MLDVWYGFGPLQTPRLRLVTALHTPYGIHCAGVLFGFVGVLDAGRMPFRTYS